MSLTMEMKYNCFREERPVTFVKTSKKVMKGDKREKRRQQEFRRSRKTKRSTDIY